MDRSKFVPLAPFDSPFSKHRNVGENGRHDQFGCAKLLFDSPSIVRRSPLARMSASKENIDRQPIPCTKCAFLRQKNKQLSIDLDLVWSEATSLKKSLTLLQKDQTRSSSSARPFNSEEIKKLEAQLQNAREVQDDLRVKNKELSEHKGTLAAQVSHFEKSEATLLARIDELEAALRSASVDQARLANILQCGTSCGKIFYSHYLLFFWFGQAALRGQRDHARREALGHAEAAAEAAARAQELQAELDARAREREEAALDQAWRRSITDI